MRLRHFACLSKGDIVAINYNNKIYELNVLETKPAAAVSIIECDMNVEFEAPPGYVVSVESFSNVDTILTSSLGANSVKAPTHGGGRARVGHLPDAARGHWVHCFRWVR